LTQSGRCSYNIGQREGRTYAMTKLLEKALQEVSRLPDEQ